MKHLERRIMQMGFHILQEKEDLVYFEKTFFREKCDDHMVFILFDRKGNRIHSIEPYTSDKMEPVSNDSYWNLFKKKRKTS